MSTAQSTNIRNTAKYMTDHGSVGGYPVRSGFLSNKNSQLKQNFVAANNEMIPENIIRNVESSNQKKLNNKLPGNATGHTTAQGILLKKLAVNGGSFREPKINSLESKETSGPNSYRGNELYLEDNKYKSGPEFPGVN